MVVFMMVWHAGNIVCPNGLVSEWSVAHKWHSSTSVCRLWGHGVHANHHCDCKRTWSCATCGTAPRPFAVSGVMVYTP